MDNFIEQQIKALQNAKTATEITNYTNYFIQILAENLRLTEQLQNSLPLPCKVRDTVWVISRDIDRNGFYYYISKAKVNDIMMPSFGKLEFDLLSELYPTAHTNYKLNELNKTWFTDRTEAEAKLNELEGEKQ